MTLLAPFSALAAAALCVPVLVLLYMLRLRRRPVRVSSTLLWRSAVDDLQANVPLRWLRASWLLFLHVLILGLLIVALGRPVLSGGGAVGSRVVILLDRSASMRAADGKGGAARWDAARARCASLADEAIGSGGASVALVAFGAEARVVAGFSTSVSELRDALNGLTTTDQPANLQAALRVVGTLTAPTGEEGSARATTVVELVTDGSLDTSGDLTLAGGEVRVVSVAPAVPEEGPDNLGIVACAARRDYSDPALTRVLVRVVNASRVARDIAVALSLNDRVVERRALRVPGGSEGASVTFEVHAPEGGVVTADLDRLDVLAADNRASLVLAPAARARVMLVRANPVTELAGAAEAADSSLAPWWLLADALGELRASLRVVSAAEYERLVSAGELGADLVVFEGVTPSVVPRAASLSFGAGLPVSGLAVAGLAESAESASDRGGSYVVAWSRAHPVLRDVSLDSVYVAGRPRVVWTGSAAGFTSLADGVNGTLIGLLNDGPYRRVVVAFDPASSNWPLQAGFPIFLSAAADYLTQRGEESAGRAFRTGESVVVRAGAGAGVGAGRVELVGPERLVAAAGRERSDSEVSFGLVERAGLYRVEPAGRDAVVALNLVDTTETMLRSATELRVSGRTVGAAGGGGVGRELWAWFVGAAGALLVVEWLVYAARMRV